MSIYATAPPEQAAELVRYVNIEKKYGVEYWAIGNEPTFVCRRIGNLAVPMITIRSNSIGNFAYLPKQCALSILHKTHWPELHQFGPVETAIRRKIPQVATG